MSTTPRFRRTYLPLWIELPLIMAGRFLYNVRTRALEKVPLQGGALLVANHISYVDLLVLMLVTPRRIRFVGFDEFVRAHRFFAWLFRVTGTIPISPERPLEGMRAIIRVLEAGEMVCLFPEGEVSRTGQLMELRAGFEMLAHKAKVPVVPVAHDGLYGSVFSFAGHKYIWKSPRLKPTQVFVAFGDPIPPEKADLPTIRKALLDLGHEAFEERPFLRRNLARESVRNLAKSPHRVCVVDRTAERKQMRAGQLLAAAAVLARHIRKTIPDQRVGIVLPPGAGATIVNLAVSCAGKTPVNLNFTAGRAALESSLRIGEVRTILSADILKTKFPAFPWTEDTRDTRGLIEAAGGKKAMLPWLLAAYLLPNQWVARLMKLPRTGDREEAALLFTSGSSGEPKGVVLTHRNILANCAQVSSTSILPASATLIGCLPVFHSFGFTVTIWYPFLRGCKLVTVPSPLDTRKIVDAIAQEKATVMVGAPTFLRPFLKKAEIHELKSLELIVAGAEKLPLDLYQAFLKDFHLEIMQGYGLTETSPVANVNQPDPPPSAIERNYQYGKRLGSVGRLMPGMTARVMDPETELELPAGSVGMLWLKGPNVFGGYLKDPEKTAAGFRDGWYITGDLARFDHDGFLYIEGRLSRFSKIGGEMVPHGTVEQAIQDAFGWEVGETPLLTVVGVPDASKGEQLVLLTTQDLTLEQLREALQGSGLPSLWIPRHIEKVEKIPQLGSGKVDLKNCRAVAMGAKTLK